MVIPGFTAETSLYRSARTYVSAGPYTASGDRSVIPATCSQDFCGPCIHGSQTCCVKGGLPHKEPCDDGNGGTVTCGGCSGVRHCSDGSTKACSCA